jgi:hypothetical protein
VSSSLERISRASFLLSSFLLHTRYCGASTPDGSERTRGSLLHTPWLHTSAIFTGTCASEWHMYIKAAIVCDMWYVSPLPQHRTKTLDIHKLPQTGTDKRI